MNQGRGPNKYLIYFYVVLMIAVMLLNAIVFPALLKPRITEVDYGTFVKMVENGKVRTVDINDNETEITFAAVGENGKEELFVTGYLDDPELVNRLLKSNVEFSKVIPKENSPLINFILTWIFPILLFWGLGQLLLNSMQKKMGGNAMSFGRSNAKVYAEAETGVTFDDVAGQDEAKEALKEIVDFLHNPAKYKAIGANMPKGALLVGPPGTGKTLLARAVAGESKVPFFSISGSEFARNVCW